jgi:ribose 5-phosphate isomerase B
MRIAVGADHAGYRLKDRVAAWLLTQGHDVVDHGTHDASSVDYPDYAFAVANAVRTGAADRGVLVCGTGQGMAMTANRVEGVRAAVVADPFSAQMAAEHNDARVLCLGERVVGDGVALACVESWVNATFAGGRHLGRIEKMGRVRGE